MNGWGCNLIRLRRCLTALTLILAASACGILPALEALLVGGADAAQATEDAARQTEETLHTLQHALLYIPVYLMGEWRKPLWGKLKALNGRRKSKKAAA